MITVHRIICTWLGIGYIGKGSGTIAAMFCAVCWWLATRQSYSNAVLVTATLLILVLGVWSAGKVEAGWGKDSSKVVIDEVAGMCISLLFIPPQVKYIVAGFILFRFFDIVKPLFIRRLENLRGGWGVMADDVLAGIYSNILLQVMVTSKLF
jgi:phosphatidylglycerophosphatase A